jgi:hypothetical protein
MDIQELANKAAERINHRQTIKVPGDAGIQLVMPHRNYHADTRYLAGKNSPKGNYLSHCKEGEIITFNAIDVLAWCVAKGATVNIVVE